MALILCHIVPIFHHTYATNSVQSSPWAAKRSTAHTDQPTKSKKKRSDGTETSDSWQAEKIECIYKARAKRLWKQAHMLLSKQSNPTSKFTLLNFPL